MRPVLSFRSLDAMHYEETGEHMSPLPGDAAPHPLEYYVQKTKQAQERRNVYARLMAEMLTSAVTSLRMTQTRSLHGTPYDFAHLERGVITLSFHGQKVLELHADGKLREPPTPVCSRPSSPAPRFQLSTPAWLLADSTGVTEEGGAAAEPAAAPSRLRKGFLRLLAAVPPDALWAELEEWQEEEARAREHREAVEEELRRRGLAPAVEEN
jgi:hypothetical protein